MRLGLSNIASMFLGTTAISRIMLGTSLLWESYSPQNLFSPTTLGWWWSANKDDMWQDTSRLIPVQNVGDPIRSVRVYTSSGPVYFTRSGNSGIATYRENSNGRGYIESPVNGGLNLPTLFPNFTAPVEVYWRGTSSATSGAGPVGTGIQYQITGRRLGLLGASPYLTGIPVANGGGLGRAQLTGTVNFSVLRTYSLTARLDTGFMEASLDGVSNVSGTATETLAVTGDNGTVSITGGYGINIYGGIIIFRTLSSQERTDLLEWLYGLERPLTPLQFGPSTWTPASLSPAAWYSIFNEQGVLAETTTQTPVTIYGYPIARILDLSGNNRSATSPVLVNRPFLGRIPVTGRRNRNLYSQEFEDSGWTKNNSVTYTPNIEIAPDGSTTAGKLAEPGIAVNTNEGFALINTSALSQRSGVVSVYAKAAERTRVNVGAKWTGGVAGTGIIVDLITRTQVGTYDASPGNISSTLISATDAGNGWVRIAVRITNLSDVSDVRPLIAIANGTTVSYTGTSGNGIFVWGCQFESGTAVTAYQTVRSDNDITEAGVKSVNHFYNPSTRSMGWTAPTNANYTIAYSDTSGLVTVLTGQSLSGSVNIMLTPRLVEYIAIPRALTTQEDTDLRAYLANRVTYVPPT